MKISDRPTAPLLITLKLADVHAQVSVTESAAQVSTDAAENLDTITLDRQMLDNLPIFDQNYVAAMSQFLDAGAVGTGGVTLVVNGMEDEFRVLERNSRLNPRDRSNETMHCRKVI